MASNRDYLPVRCFPPDERLCWLSGHRFCSSHVCRVGRPHCECGKSFQRGSLGRKGWQQHLRLELQVEQGVPL